MKLINLLLECEFLCGTKYFWKTIWTELSALKYLKDISRRSTAIRMTKYTNKQTIAKYIKRLKTVLSESSSNESEKNLMLSKLKCWLKTNIQKCLGL